jgi:uncharacterized protein (DUF302 family)
MKHQTMRMLAVASIAIAIVFSAQTAYAQMKPMDGSKIAMSKYSFSESVDIIKGAIEEQNLMVINIVDGQKMMRMAGKKIDGLKQIFFLHPKYMAKILKANKMAGLAIPLKLIVMEKDGKVIVRYMLASTSLKAYKGTEAVAKELDGLIAKIIAEVTK